MSLPPGTRIGHYEIVASIGAGGMGEVYRARDTKLDRDVALKVLPDLFTSDPDRLTRFEREAKVLASLNHPNIAQIFGFEGHAIAMELVEGETLDELLASGAETSRGLPLERTLAIMRQIASALEAAHDQGIVHRDLKPANVKVREDGTVKVLDFGLAKAFASDEAAAARGVGNSPTLTARATQLGMILGTAAYMAPEQAKGRAVDRRADVWAFGVVFFETLAGRRAFEGDDVSDVLASVLKTEPDWSVLPADLPAPVRRLLKRCLEKDPKRRLRDIGEGMLQLDEGLASGAATSSTILPVTESGAAFPASAIARPRPRWRRAVSIAAIVIVTALATLGVSRWMTPVPTAPAAVRFVFTPESSRFYETVVRQDLAVSSNGRLIAYSAREGVQPPNLYLRRLDLLDSSPIRGSEGAVGPFFSPDAAWVGFVDWSDGSLLKKVSVLGGPPLQIAKVSTTVAGAAWMTDGTIVIGVPGGPLYRVGEGGGTPEALTALDKTARETDHLWPSAVPGTSLVLFVTNGGGNSPIDAGRLAVVDVKTGKTVRLGLAGMRPRYVASGHIVYGSADRSLRAIRFDPSRMSVVGNPVPVLEGVRVKQSGAANFDVSNDGRLVYAGGAGSTGVVRTLVWVDRAGRETPIAAAPGRTYYYARLSPDGKRLSLDVRDQQEDIWIWDLVRETMSRLTDQPGPDEYGLWTADGEHVVFSSVMSGRNELFWKRPDGVAQPEKLTDTTAEKLNPFPNAITPDGKQVIFRSSVGGRNDLFLVETGGSHAVRKLLATEHDERNAALSPPDGKFMVFESNLSGRYEIYARPFPDVESRQWPVSTTGGTKPAWSSDGREIFYVAGDGKLNSVPVNLARGFELGKPAPLFDTAPYFEGAQGRSYDVAPDGKRFVMIKEPAGLEARAMPITVVLNWADELRSRLK